MRAIRARKPDNAKADREFSAKVLGRDERICRFQRWDGEKWREHGIKGHPDNPLQAAHIYGRPHLSPQTKYEPIIGLSGCDRCHRAYDSQDTSVRVPPQREDAAYGFLQRAQTLGKIKVLPSRRQPPGKPEAA